MITANLIEFKTRQNELHRQAENYRLARSIEQAQSSVSRFMRTVGIVFTQLFS